MNRRVAIIPSTVGFHWEEVFAAFKEFKKAGWKIDLFTVDGQAAIADPKSLERRPFLSLLGLGLNHSISPETPVGKELAYLLNHEVQPIDLLFSDAYDALYIPGGHGCLYDVNVNGILHKKILEAFLKDKLLAAVCHGTSTFAFVDANGIPIIKGKKMTGFPDLMDKILQKAHWIYEKFLPIPFSNEQKMKKSGARMTIFDALFGMINPTQKRQDLPFVTGVGPKAAKGVARAVIKAAEQKEINQKEGVLIED